MLIIFSSANDFNIHVTKHRIAKPLTAVIKNDNEVLISLFIIRDKKRDLARNSNIVQFILGSIWKETKRCLRTYASRETRDSEKAEFREKNTPEPHEIHFYISIT